jgi:hypothetical protein
LQAPRSRRPVLRNEHCGHNTPWGCRCARVRPWSFTRRQGIDPHPRPCTHLRRGFRDSTFQSHAAGVWAPQRAQGPATTLTTRREPAWQCGMRGQVHACLSSRVTVTRVADDLARFCGGARADDTVFTDLRLSADPCRDPTTGSDVTRCHAESRRSDLPLLLSRLTVVRPGHGDGDVPTPSCDPIALAL